MRGGATISPSRFKAKRTAYFMPRRALSFGGDPASAQRGIPLADRIERVLKPNSGTRVDRSLPRDLEKSRNAEVITAQMV